MKAHLLTACLLFAGVPLTAQCPFTSVTTNEIGAGCNFVSTGFCAIVSLPTTLEVQLDAAQCSLDITVNAWAFCGATVPLVALALGTQPASVPLPEFGASCELHVAPVVLLAQSTTTFTLPLPPGISTLGFVVQGAAWSHSPWGADGIVLSNALAVTVQ